jgi:hypothetical protein
MILHSENVISNSSTAAGADELSMHRRASKRTGFWASYTVTDAGVAAGEDWRGYCDEFSIRGVLPSGKEVLIFEAQRNELDECVYALAPYGDDDPTSSFNIQVVDSDVNFYDALPTTAEAQQVYFLFNMPHDYSMYTSVTARVEWRTLADEHVSATATSWTLGVFQETGSVTRSIGITRSSYASSTEPFFTMGEYPVIGGQALLANVNNVLEMHAKGKDGIDEASIGRAEHDIAYLALWSYYTGNVPAADTVTRFILPPGILIAQYDNRKLVMRLTTAEAIVWQFISLFAEHAVAGAVKAGDLSRGTASVIERNYTGTSASLAASAPVLRRALQ